VHRLVDPSAGLAGGGTYEKAPPVLADPGGLQIRVDEDLEFVTRRHLVILAAFLMQPNPALALRTIVFDAHGDDDADSSLDGAGSKAYHCA
jgi:hypothetical protein